MLCATPLFIRLKEPRCVAKTINIFSNKYCFADCNHLTFIYRVTIQNNVRVTASVSKREKFQERNADTFPTQKNQIIYIFCYAFWNTHFTSVQGKGKWSIVLVCFKLTLRIILFRGL
jgi:hypothetical protein